MFKTLGNNQNWIASILLIIGNTYAMHRNDSAIAFFESCTNLNKRYSDLERVAESLRISGLMLAELYEYEKAYQVLQKALTLYQDLSLPEDIKLTEEALEQLKAKSPSTFTEESILEEEETQSHEFAILMDDNLISRFTVTAEGEIVWGEEPQGLSKPSLVGLANLWRVVCIDSTTT
jgi:tetratricopeptide (TPR) repeat protein